MKKKFLLSAICVCLLICVFALQAFAFSDISDEETALSVATLESMGIVTGTSATTFSPSLTLTRAQICTMIIRAIGQEKATSSYVNQGLFNDVKSNMWHAGYVNLAYKQGIINGYGNGKFGPDDEVTYGQFVTILLRLLGYTENDIGKLWPADYIVFASDLGMDENVDLGANDSVSRGNAAILLYNTLRIKAKGSNGEFYRSIGGYASSTSAILLDNNVSDSTAGDLYAYVLSGSSAEMRYFEQKNRISDAFIGKLGSLLLNADGEVIGFLPEEADTKDVVVKEAKISGITAADGTTYKISGSASVISGNGIYSYSSTGYVKVNAHAGQSARFYYSEDGTVRYIYLTAGTDPAKSTVAVASTDAAAAELASALGITAENYTILKNGGTATTAAITMYDVAYYDAMTNTLRTSDYKITGYIEYATPSVTAAESMTLSGTSLSVLQCAWDSLSDFTLGSYVTVLLTDTGSVAAVLPAETLGATMYGILSTDGSSITLCGSNLVMKPKDISANVIHNGSLVKIDTKDSDRVVCAGVGSGKVITSADKIDTVAQTVGGRSLAPGCSIYEWAGNGYVYSLAGVQGASSKNFDEIFWTDKLDASYVTFYHVNAAGLVDILLLKDVTGNYYTYGELRHYKNAFEGQNGVSIVNDSSPNGSARYMTNISSGGFGGIALVQYSKSTAKVASFARPTAVKNAAPASFTLNADDEWLFTVKDTVIPVSDNVKVYIDTIGKWQSGEEGLLTALSSELNMTVYYDRELNTGAQVRMIVLTAK